MFAKTVKGSKLREEARAKNATKTAPRKKKGHYVPKGKSRFDEGVRPTFFKTREEAVQADKDIKNFNRRSKARYQKVKKAMPWLTYEEAYLGNLVPHPIEGGILDLKRRSDLDNIYYRIARTGTKADDARRLARIRDRAHDLVNKTVGLSDARVEWMDECIDTMSLADLARWQHDNPIKDWFEVYDDKSSMLDSDELDELEQNMLESFLPYAKRPIPAFVPRQL